MQNSGLYNLVNWLDKVYNELILRYADKENKFLFVRTEYRIEKIDLSKILYIQGMKDYLQIVSENKKIMTLQSFKNMLEFLPKKDFVRVHNSYIISIDKIVSIERNRIKIGEKLIPITDSYKEGFFRLLTDKKYLI